MVTLLPLSTSMLADQFLLLPPKWQLSVLYRFLLTLSPSDKALQLGLPFRVPSLLLLPLLVLLLLLLLPIRHLVEDLVD